MDIQDILSFLSALKENNNREWFAENKMWYEKTKSEFEKICTLLIDAISTFDEEIKTVNAKDCIFRIYRDTRFHDKTPYKTHMGAFIASHGGRKSQRSGYYFHLEPNACFISCGVWCPEPPLLKELRKSIFENIEEFKDITENKEFKATFTSFYEEEMLKSIPRGYPKKFEDAYFLKLKHYLVSKNLSDSFFEQPNSIKNIADIFKTALPLHLFLNYTVDEVMNY